MPDLVIFNGGDVSLPARKVEGTIERVITAIPAPRTRPVLNPDESTAKSDSSARNGRLDAVIKSESTGVRSLLDM